MMERHQPTEEQDVRSDPQWSQPQKGRRGNQHNNSTRKTFNEKRQEDHRTKKGIETMNQNLAEIKSEIFAFVTDEQLAKLTSNVNKNAQMLPVTTRNVGLSTANLVYTATQYRPNIVPPNIYKMYRVFLAAFEAKIIKVRKESGLLIRNPEAIYAHSGARANFSEDIAMYNAYPLGIKMTIDAVGAINDTNDVAYLPVIAKMRRDGDGNLQPRPETTLLSNLRETVEELADVETAEEIRIAYHNACAIPGAIWSNNHVLTNPDEIIPSEYDINSDLPGDIISLTPFMSALQKAAPKLVCEPLETKIMDRYLFKEL